MTTIFALVLLKLLLAPMPTARPTPGRMEIRAPLAPAIVVIHLGLLPPNSSRTIR